jgi:Tfp pilus assembly protein PilX
LLRTARSYRPISITGRFAARLRARLRSERGIAIPTVLWVLVISMGLALAASTSAVVSQSGASKDNARKRALEIADSGVQQALYRANKVTNGIATNPICLVDGGGGALAVQNATAGQWCAAQTGDVGGGTYSYQVKATYITTQNGRDYSNADIVSTGTYNGLSRRVKVHAKSLTSQQSGAFGGFAASSLSDLTLNGGSRINGGGASNQSVLLQGSTICGDILHGQSGTLSLGGSSSQCAGYHVLTGSLSLSPVDQGTVATVNDNGRFFALDPKRGSPSWNAATRELSLGNHDEVTLGGSNYSFCKLIVSNGGKLYIAAGARVKMYFDSPEHCGYKSGVTQLDFKGTLENDSTSGSPPTPDPSNAEFLMVGSDTMTTYASMTANGAVADMILYAPRTIVTMNGGAGYQGAVAGKAVDMEGGATITYDNRAETLTETTNLVPLFTRDSYIECQGLTPTGSNPDTNC